MSLFETAIRAYFAEKLGQEIGSVVFDYDEGYRYSSHTYADPSFKINVYSPEGLYVADYADTTAGEFLTELFGWEATGERA
jgi:hypothetical protein